MNRDATSFALDVLQARHAALVPGENLFFSPFSLSAALSMTAAGARGDTLAELERVLCLEPGDEKHEAYGALQRALLDAARDDVELRVVNRLFANRGFALEPHFLALTRKKYGAPVEQADFVTQPDEERGRINAWVAEETRERISDLIPPGGVSPDTRIVLVNAVYFLGKWRAPFDPQDTSPLPFHGVEGTHDVEMMKCRFNGKAEYAEYEGAQWLRLRYGTSGGEDDVAMVIGLPAAKDGLPALISALDGARVASVRSSLARPDVFVSLPRFRIEYALAAKEVLKALGIVRAFDGALADFSGIGGTPRDLVISEVFHKAFVDVNEVGTEAAAATATNAMFPTSVPPPPKLFIADHPFLFWIEHVRSGAMLFTGVLTSP